tara:strand:+ start:1032 stop:1178 length:147 start_codon:yes stop_codon:yes gene_type:complete
MPNGPEETRKKVEITSKREIKGFQVHPSVETVETAEIVEVLGAREVKT